MSIIKCCECGHDVSTFAESCPHCGCPVSISSNRSTPYDNEQENKVKKYDVVLNQVGSDRLKIVRFIREANSIDLEASFNLVENLPSTIIQGVSKDTANAVISKLGAIGGVAEAVESQNTNRATEDRLITESYLFTKDKPLVCHRCGSSAVTIGTRGYSLVWGFIGSNKTVNRCGRCGYTWKP